MNPLNRTLLLVTVDDAAEAGRTFDMLMSDTVDPPQALFQTRSTATLSPLGEASRREGGQ